MINKKMGNCALCLEWSDLQLSHFVSKGAYKRLRNAAGKIKDPIVVTAKFSVATSKQMVDFLLCSKCEIRFNRLGENYTLAQMNYRGNFPLLDRLRVSPSIDFTLREGIYSGPAIGIDTEKLAYFALSVAWRSAVHTWTGPKGHVPRAVNLGAHQEPIRKYLLGKAGFPVDVRVLVTACTDTHSQNVFYTPTPQLGTPNTAIAFLICGIHFSVFLGPTQPAATQELCCFSSSRQLVFSRDIRMTTLRAYAALAATTREIGALAVAKQDLVNQRPQ
jgi:hypothetical protein